MAQLILVLCFCLFFGAFSLPTEESAQCIAWVRRQSDDSVSSVTPVSVGLRNDDERPSGYRMGKKGPIGPPGPPGLPGQCSCNETDKSELELEMEILKEQVQRMRLTAPETFCLLGMKDRSIPDDGISVSSNPSVKNRGRLDDPNYGWRPSSNDLSRTGREWIMADLGKVRNVTGVVTQGSNGSDHWTKTFKVEHSSDGHSFIDVTKNDGSELIFNGNSDRSTKVVNRFPDPVMTRFIRIYPMSFQHWPYIRFDVLDC